MKCAHEINVLGRISDFYARKHVPPYVGSYFFKSLLFVGLPFNDGNIRGMVREIYRHAITAPWCTLVAKEYHGAPTIAIV